MLRNFSRLSLLPKSSSRVIPSLSIIPSSALLSRQLHDSTPPPRLTKFLPPYLHDGIVHNPLGGGSYLFKSNFVDYEYELATRTLGYPSSPTSSPRSVENMVIHVGAQPNNSPHVGTLVTFALAMHMAKEFKAKRGPTVTLSLDLVDTAPDNEAQGVPKGYQKSLRYTGGVGRHLADYEEILEYFSALAGGVDTVLTDQEDLAFQPSTPEIVRTIVKERKWLGPLLAPEKKLLGLRAACPQCGLADKPGLRNHYHDEEGKERIDFTCPDHGIHSVDLRNPSEMVKLEYNAPLRNLVRGLILAHAPAHGSHLRVTGSDYAGGYQENLLLRPWAHLAALDPTNISLRHTPLIIYAPLIQDWAGSKLSKSLYIRKGGYDYMKKYGLDYLLSLDKMRESGRDPKVVFDEVGRWVADPKKLFRSYSVEYLHSVFEGRSS